MKIKVKPEDFIVDELTDVLVKKAGDFGLYLLEKEGWNTADLIKKLSRQSRIPSKDISYGGKKDRHALTRQYVTIRVQRGEGREPKRLEISADTYSLRFVGFMDRPMGPDLILGNRFEVTIRDISEGELRSAYGSLDSVRETGYPNYFDDQRFGSFDPRQGFITEKILRGHYNGALKIYFTHIRPEDRREEKERKRFFFDSWGDWKICLERARTEAEKKAFSFLAEDPKGFVPLLQGIPREEMSLFFSAYQSYLWNELLRRIVKTRVGDSLRVYPGIAGDYLFYTSLGDKDSEYLHGLKIPTPASNVGMPDHFTEAIYSAVLEDKDIKPSQFNNRKIRQAFFKGTERKAVIVPEDLSGEIAEDEVYNGKKKLGLKFVLPRGSYGTMLVKRLFSKSLGNAVADKAS